VTTHHYKVGTETRHTKADDGLEMSTAVFWRVWGRHFPLVNPKTSTKRNLFPLTNVSMQ